MAVQLLRHLGRRTPVAVLGCMTLTTALLLSFVYDSLESPLFITMLALGLMNRERLEDAAARTGAPTALTAAARAPGTP